MWEESVGLLKEEVKEMRREMRPRVKRCREIDLRESKEVYEAVQEEIRGKNRKMEELNVMQARIAYICIKNKELDTKIRKFMES